MVSCVSSDLVLSINGVNFLVGVIHEHVLCAVFLDALGGAFAGLVVRAFDAALAVRDVSGPAAVGCHGESGCKESCRRECCKTYFHNSPSWNCSAGKSRSAGLAKSLSQGQVPVQTPP